MRDKVLFFILGAVLATIAYFLGDLETTAEDEYREIDHLRVKSLHVKEGIGVGDIGEKFISIITDNEFAQINLYGAEVPDRRDDFDLGDTPVISLVVGDDAALIRAKSHNERPDAMAVMGVLNVEGKEYASSVIIEDSNGKKSVFSDRIE